MYAASSNRVCLLIYHPCGDLILVNIEGNLTSILRKLFCQSMSHYSMLCINLQPKVERSMKDSLQSVLNDACGAYAKSKRTEWVQSWPGQIVLAGSAIHWTAEVTKVNFLYIDRYIYQHEFCKY